MNNLGSITQIYGTYDEINIDGLIGAVCAKYGLQEKSTQVIDAIKEFLEGVIDVNGFAVELRKTNLSNEQLSAMIKDIDMMVFGPFKDTLNRIIAEEHEVISYQPPEEPEDIMHNAGIELDENPAEVLESKPGEIIANINKYEMKTFSNAGISFDELSNQNAVLSQGQYSNQHIDEAKLIEGIEHPTKNEPVIFKGVAQTKLHTSFGIPSTKTDQSLPKVENFSPRSNDPYRNQIDE